MPTLIEVWDSRLGITEVSGRGNNPIILQWCKDAGHAEIIEDATAWCSTSMCSACKEASLPFPPVNANPMARSWLTMGVGVSVEDAAEGDIVVWPRQGINSIYGHVNMIRHIKRDGGKTLVRCIGGNQSKAGTEGAVTLTGWTDLKGALPNGIRRLVPATVPALRNAGSTEIRKADNLEKMGIVATFLSPIVAGIKSLFGPLIVPEHANLAEGFTFWQSLMGAANGFAREFLTAPAFFGVCLLGIAAWFISRQLKAARVAKHQMGVPLSVEVAALGSA